MIDISYFCIIKIYLKFRKTDESFLDFVENHIDTLLKDSTTSVDSSLTSATPNQVYNIRITKV